MLNEDHGLIQEECTLSTDGHKNIKSRTLLSISRFLMDPTRPIQLNLQDWISLTTFLGDIVRFWILCICQIISTSP